MEPKGYGTKRMLKEYKDSLNATEKKKRESAEETTEISENKSYPFEEIANGNFQNLFDVRYKHIGNKR